MGDSCTEIKHLAFSNLSSRFLISLQFSWAPPHTATKELAACWKETNICIELRALDQPFYGFLWDLLVLCPKHQKFPRTCLLQLVFNSVMRSQLSFGMDTKEGWNAQTPPPPIIGFAIVAASMSSSAKSKMQLFFLLHLFHEIILWCVLAEKEEYFLLSSCCNKYST